LRKSGLNELKKEKFHFSEKLIDDLILKTERMIDEKSFNSVIDVLENEAGKFYFDSIALANFYRVLNSIFDVSTFLKEIVHYPHHAEIIMAIVSSSNYLTDIVVQNPEYLYQIFDDDYLRKIFSLDELENELKTTIDKFKNFDTKIRLIRQFKKRYILKIGLQDILQIYDLKTITHELSILAKTIISILFDLCYNEILTKYRIKNIKNKFSICALGKLGGDELNYSSDVDLIIFYDKNTSIKNCNKDYHEILTEAIQTFINVATQISSNGFIYRIDFRLRPDGKYSPLCKEMNDYIKYYETRGEDWEKQMLIKLSFISGDINLYNQFKSFVNSYVYRSIVSESIKEKIKKMKLNIEKNNLEDDVKTFEGGIRDIEFSVQALQLLNGNKISSLKNGNTLEVLDVLLNNKLLTQNEYKNFKDAYIFYRKIEHFLQLMNDTQTHRLPEDFDTQMRLSKYLALKNYDDFKEKIEYKRKIVRKIYISILSSSNKENILEEIKFNNRSKAENNLSFLKTGKGIIGRKEFDSHTIASFEKIETQLYKYLQKSDNPDVVLENFTKVIRFSNYPSIWFNEFKNEIFFEQFLSICNFSQKAIDMLITSKTAGELLLSRKVFIKNYNDEIKILSIKELIFILSIQHALHLIDSVKFSEALSDYLNYYIDKNFTLFFNNKNLFIAALGSFGAKTISFNSDIDLIVVADKIDDDYKTENEFQIFLQKLKDELKPFEIDFRLRPEGKKSQLVWDIENYQKYLNQRAKVWEFQSLCKLNFISGNKNLFNKFLNVIVTSLEKFSESEIKSEIKAMHFNLTKDNRERTIKNIFGGLNTIDFLFQFLILKEKKQKLFNGNYLQTIKNFAQRNKDVKTLLKNYKFLKEIEITYQNLFESNNSLIELSEQKQKRVSKYLQIENDKVFNEKIQQIINTNIEIYNKYFTS
jgi:glutamate-ammonia-ligase adenylyltransferase